MNIAPQELIGKIVKDCYQDWNGKVIIEFTDGTKITISYEARNDYYNGSEISIPIII